MTYLTLSYTRNLGRRLLRDDTKTAVRETTFFLACVGGASQFFSERRKKLRGRVSTKEKKGKKFFLKKLFLIKGHCKPLNGERKIPLYLASKNICKFLAFDHTMKDTLPSGSRAHLSPYPFTFKRCSTSCVCIGRRDSLTHKRISIGILP